MNFPPVFIQAVPWWPERTARAVELARETGGQIIWDQKKLAFHTWTLLMEACGTEAAVLFEDDAVLGPRWRERMLETIERHPDKVINFFVRGQKLAGIRDGVPGEYLTSGRNFWITVGYYLPAGYAAELLEYGHAYAQRLWRHNKNAIVGYDMVIADWLVERQEKFVLVNPSIVDHRVGRSMIDPERELDRSSEAFWDPEA